MRVLITGVSGMLGAYLYSFLEKQGFDVYGTGNSTFAEQPENYKVFDLRTSSYNELIDWANPEIIILSGAITNGNYCNDNPNEAFDINGISVKKFVDSTAVSVKFVYISTDAVFPSRLHRTKEIDCVDPENIYGKSKELGEFFIRLSGREFYIIRTTIVGLNLNSSKQGFVEWIINSSKLKEQIGLFDDVRFNPITIYDLGKEIHYLIEKVTFSNEILHISGLDIITKYEFGMALLNELNLDISLVKRTKIASFKDRAKRCNDQTFDCSYYQKTYNRQLPTFSKTIETIKKYYESN